jgi:CheY-like chemotaxis protein
MLGCGDRRRSRSGLPVSGSAAAAAQSRTRLLADNRIALRGDFPDDSGVLRTVLVVDDNPGFRARARRWLEADGFTVIAEAGDGASALDAVRDHRPAVVLLDVHLPDVSGLDVAEQLAGTQGGPAVVLTSTRDASDFGDRLARSGARGFLPKSELSGDAVAALLG